MSAKLPTGYEVYARIRDIPNVTSQLTVDGTTVTQKDSKVSCSRVFQGAVNNQYVYENSLQANVDRVLQGYNSHVLFYGVSESGKIETVLGEGEKDPGLLGFASNQIFNNVERSNSKKFLITASMYQLHSSFSKGKAREFITDLINPDTSKTLTVADYRDTVQDVAEIVVKSSEQLMLYISQGFAVHRALSQRSAADKGHVFIDVRIESTEKNDPIRVTYGTLRLAIIANSGSKAVEFNTGIKELHNVIDMKSKNVDEIEIPYTSSKLTQLLQSSLSTLRSNAFGTVFLFLHPVQENSDSLLLGSKLLPLVISSKVNFNTVAAAVNDLRDEIRKRRDALRLDNSATFIQDVRPEQIQILQRLIIELERVKSETWKVRRDNSAAVLRQRVARLKSEGLAGVLLATNIDIPPELRLDAKEKLRGLISKHNSLRVQEDKVETSRHKYTTLAKRIKPESAPDDKIRVQAEKQQQLMRQEELSLNKQISVYNTSLNEFSMAQKKILALESKKSKLFLFPEDAAAVQRARDQELWLEIKKEREELLDSEYKTLQERMDGLTKEIEAAKDVETCKKLLTSLSEQLYQKEVRVRELEVDKDLVIGSLYRKDADNEHQLQRFQEHMFFVFRNYRSHFEEQKTRIETRYRDLLENAVKDALKLQEENNRLRSEFMKKDAYTYNRQREFESRLLSDGM